MGQRRQRPVSYSCFGYLRLFIRTIVSTDPVKRKQFKQFVNTEERRPQTEIITERGQQRPADWAKAYPGVKLTADQIVTPKSEWKWIKVASKDDMMPTEAGTTSVAVKYGDTQLAVYHVPKRGYYSTQQMYVRAHVYSNDELNV